MDYLIKIDEFKMESFIVYLYSMRFQILMFMYLKIIFTLINSSYPDEMQHFAALCLGLCCLSKYSLRSQMVRYPL